MVQQPLWVLLTVRVSAAHRLCLLAAISPLKPLPRLHPSTRPGARGAPSIILPHQEASYVRHIALDIGGSLIKLVYFSPDPSEDGSAAASSAAHPKGGEQLLPGAALNHSVLHSSVSQELVVAVCAGPPCDSHAFCSSCPECMALVQLLANVPLMPVHLPGAMQAACTL